jgi:hypothetical protein
MMSVLAAKSGFLPQPCHSFFNQEFHSCLRVACSACGLLEQGFKSLCIVLFPNSRTVNPMWADNELLSALIASDNATQLMIWRVYRSLAQLHRHRAEWASLFAIGFKAHGREHSTHNQAQAVSP